MKRKILLIIMILLTCMLMVGCGKKEVKEKKEVDENYIPAKGTTNWINDNVDVQADMSVEDIEMYNKALENTKAVKDKYEPIALLAKKVVTGTNYMFFCKKDDKFYTVVVYKSLEGNLSVKTVSQFNYVNNVNEDINYSEGKKANDWEVTIPSKSVQLNEKIQTVFDNAKVNNQSVNYSPIAVLGHQIANGTHYALLAYGESNDAKKDKGIYLVTLYDDLDGNQSIDSSSYVDLNEYSK